MIRDRIETRLDRRRRRTELHVLGLTDDDIAQIDTSLGSDALGVRFPAVRTAALLGTPLDDIGTHVLAAERLAGQPEWHGSLDDALRAIATTHNLIGTPHTLAGSLASHIAHLAEGSRA